MKKFIIILSILIFAVVSASARDFVSVKSAYLGDGWFSYRVRMYSQPIYSAQIMWSVFAYPFRGKIDVNTPPEGWSVSTNALVLGWDKTELFEVHELPWKATLMGRSSLPGFHTQSNFFLTFSVWHYDSIRFPPAYLSANHVGFVRFPVLSPCDESEADGSPTELFEAYEIFSDPRIVGMESNSLSYYWGSTNTVMIEASHDLETWTNIAQVVGYGGTTTWHSAQPLDTYGKFFRVGFMAWHALPSNTTEAAAAADIQSTPACWHVTPEGRYEPGPGEIGITFMPIEETNSPIWQALFHDMQ